MYVHTYVFVYMKICCGYKCTWTFLFYIEIKPDYTLAALWLIL